MCSVLIELLGYMHLYLLNGRVMCNMSTELLGNMHSYLFNGRVCAVCLLNY